jgi:hypothetical protein
MDAEGTAQWKDLLVRYNLVKQLLIETEEVDDEQNTNLQAYNELKATLDHCMRWVGVEFDYALPENVCKAERKSEEYRKAVGHLKRAFYDAADLLSMLYRKKIIDVLEPYDSDILTKCLPAYYSEYRLAIEKINTRIASYRYKKGHEFEDDFEVFAPYIEDLDKLRAIHHACIESLPAMEELRQEQKAKSRRQMVINCLSIGVGIAGIIIGVILTVLA